MKKILFVCSHLYSGSGALCEALNHHPRIQGYSLAARSPYVSPQNLISLTELHHKMNNRSAIYMDELLYNHHFTVSAAYKECNFVYVVREPSPVLGYMVANEKKKPEFAARYYLFRLRRMCEMAKRSGGVLLTWEDMQTGRGIPLIEDYLNLRQPIPYDPLLLGPYRRTFNMDSVKPTLLAETESTYEKYLYWLKSQTHLRHCS